MRRVRDGAERERKMAKGETVLYYNPDGGAQMAKLTGVLFRMKIRIRKVRPEETAESVGYLVGIKGFEKKEETAESAGIVKIAEAAEADNAGEPHVIPEQMMVLCNLSDGRLSELLDQMKKAGVPRIPLKAVVTPTNCTWSFFELYKEIKAEHDTLKQAEAGGRLTP